MLEASGNCRDFHVWLQRVERLLLGVRAFFRDEVNVRP